MSMLTDVVSIRLLLSKSVHRITQMCHTQFGRNPRSVEGPPPHASHHQLLNRSRAMIVRKASWQECARIAQTSRSCTSSGGTPKLWFGRIDGGFVVSVGKEYMVT